MYWNYDLKKSQLVPFGGNPAQLEAKSDIPVACVGGSDIDSDILNIDIFGNIDIVSMQQRKYRYFDI